MTHYFKTNPIYITHAHKTIKFRKLLITGQISLREATTGQMQHKPKMHQVLPLQDAFSAS